MSRGQCKVNIEYATGARQVWQNASLGRNIDGWREIPPM